jgi:hypothetical protein
LQHQDVYLPFLLFLFDPAAGFVPPLWRVASVFFTSDCIGELEGPLVSTFETDLDFVFGLRLLTPLRPIFSPCFEIIELQV